MMKSVETLIFVDVRALPPESLLRQLGEEHHYLGISLWPLAYEGRVIAAIGIYSDEPRQWLDVEREVMEVFSKQAAIALQNARIYETSQRHLRNVRALRAIDSAITASMDLRLTLDVLLSQVVSQVSVDAAAVLLYNQHIQRLRYAADRGFRTEMVRSADFRLGEGIAGATAHDRRPVVIPDLSLIQDPYIRSLLRGGENFVSYIGLPLIAKGQVKGVLEIYNRAPLNNDPEWLAFLESIAIQAAIAVDNATMFEDLQRSNLELAIANDATLEGWARALELRDQETEGHSREVTEMTLRLARRMGMNESELVHIRRGALLHDIGKMGIPDSILLKPGPLSDEEWALMRLHPVYAYQLLSPIPFLRPALDIPYCHHERWDGGGYPRGLRGEQIPLAARIFTVVDVWSALKANRPYRTAWDDARTWAYLSAQAGSLFDPKIVEVFIQLLQESAEMANSSRGVKNH
jgi:HD-GYP domain-containing protein (c-di-GMP phosphodiesterase class II)